MGSIVLPFIEPEFSIKKNIAIVGSSGRLRDLSHGDSINTFDEVVRFNRAPTEKYEDMVGAKTTLRIVNNHVFNNNDISHEGYTDQPKDFVKDLRDSKILYFAQDLAPYWSREDNTHSSNEVYLFNYGAMELLKHLFQYDSSKNFTLGIGFICLLVHSGIKPSLFGFDIDPGPRDHYWEERPLPSDYHSISSEKTLLRKLRDHDMVNIF